MKRIIGYVVLIGALAMIKVFPIGVIPAIIIFWLLNKTSKGAVDEAILPKELREDQRGTSEIVSEGVARSIETIKKSNPFKTKSRINSHENISNSQSLPNKSEVSNNVYSAFVIVDGLIGNDIPYEIENEDTSDQRWVVFQTCNAKIKVLKSKLSYGPYSRFERIGMNFIFYP